MSVKEIAEALEQEEGTIEKIIKEMMVESVQYAFQNYLNLVRMSVVGYATGIFIWVK